MTTNPIHNTIVLIGRLPIAFPNLKDNGECIYYLMQNKYLLPVKEVLNITDNIR